MEDQTFGGIKFKFKVHRLSTVGHFWRQKIQCVPCSSRIIIEMLSEIHTTKSVIFAYL